MNLNFSGIKVLLVGDFMLDHYTFGSSSRMSPEAPVPIIIPQSKYITAGGAGNVAKNLNMLGADVHCVGFVGSDKWGKKLIEILQQDKINVDGIEILDNHITTIKKRIYLNQKQALRIDNEEIISWQPKASLNFEKYDIIIFSDYNKGALSSNWFKNQSLKNVIVDPKKTDFSFYSNCKIITPNINELQNATNLTISNDKSVIEACKSLIKKYGFEFIVAKKGSKGMTIVGKDNYFKNIEPHKVQNPDVTGAGDTVISAFALAYFKTNDIELSAKIANYAASIVVSKKGTASINNNDLKNFYD